VLTLLALAGCEPEQTPVEIELALLVEQPANFNGRLVQTAGTVRGFDSPRHFWIEDEATHRIGLLPADFVAPYVDTEIEVIGRFSYVADEGRRIRVRTIRPWAVIAERTGDGVAYAAFALREPDCP